MFFARQFYISRLRLITAVSLTLPLFIYTAAQFISMEAILDSLTLGRVNAKAFTVFLGIIIVACEWLGGQRSVTLSDAIQAVIMITSFIIMPFFVHYHWGSLGSRFETNCSAEDGKCVADYKPYMERSFTTFGKCDVSLYEDYFASSADEAALKYSARPLPGSFANKNCYASTLANNGAEYAPDVSLAQIATATAMDHAKTKTWDHTQFSSFMFLVGLYSFALQPHLMQKIFVARSQASLRKALMAMHFVRKHLCALWVLWTIFSVACRSWKALPLLSIASSTVDMDSPPMTL